MLVSPPQKLLQAGIKAKKMQIREDKELRVVWIAAAVVGLIAVYVSYQRQQALAASQQQVIAQAPPEKPRNVIYDWERIFQN